MENKINIAELLKDCPKGMKLDCTIFDTKVIYQGLSKRIPTHPIVVLTEHGFEFELTQYGQTHNIVGSKCVIFPKGKTTWEGFVPPCKFEDGDIITCSNGVCTFTSIFKNKPTETTFKQYCSVLLDNNQFMEGLTYCVDDYNLRFATEEEKAKLFKAIKDNGYKWNAETKTLSKLVQPNFEVGNKIEKCGYSFIIAEVKDDYYLTKCGNKIPIDNQDDFSLVPNKFDITTLKPYNKVLIRDRDTDEWNCNLFSYYRKNSDRPYVCIGYDGVNEYEQCIPYEGNEHLIGTTNDCIEYYKNW